MPGKDLVLGTALGYPFDKIMNFVISLKETSFTGDIGMVVGHRQRYEIEKLRTLGVRVFFFEGMPFYATKPHTARFFRLFEILQEQADRYGRVMISDVRDVIFQTDPFPVLGDCRLAAVLEDGSGTSTARTIGTCKLNAKWMRINFGRRILRRLADQRISCCGTVFGSMEGMLDYLQNMTEIAERINSGFRRFAFRRLGADTAIHNYMIYNHVIDGLETFENQKLVYTMAGSSDDHFSLDGNGVIVNEDGAASPVVHQYDRQPALRAAINAKYRKIFQQTCSDGA